MTDYKICLVCSLKFIQKKHTKGMFCSRKCHQIYQTGDKNPFYGKKHSDETKLKQSLVKMGKHNASKGIKRPNTTGENNPAKRPEVRAMISLKKRGVPLPALSGDKCHLWRGGVTSKNAQIRKSAEYKEWRRKVFQRDNWKCVFCGKKGDIHADHIKQFAYYPELRLELSNGRTLCVTCHRQTETYSRKQ